MNSWKEDIWARLVTAYAGIFIWLYPLGFAFIMIQQISLLVSQGFLGQGADMFRLFREGHKEFFFPNKPPLWISNVILLTNTFVFLPSYFALIRLYKFLQNILVEKPFIEENGRRLKFVGMVIIFITILTTIINATFMHIPSEHSTAHLVSTVLFSFFSTFFNPYLVLGLFVIVLGEVIVRGAKMKEEIDLTV